MRALAALTAVAWLALLVLAPVLPVPIAGVLYALGSHICHQRAERSFHLFAAQLPVCARCAGIYAGAAIGSLLAVSGSIRERSGAVSPRMLLAAGALPTLITLIAEWSGAWAGGNDARAGAGVWLGVAVALVVARAAATLHYGGCVPRRPIASNRPFTHI
ncbi:MAG TPA: DUF2085 domain-containing protein [Vicinamibacterales bacterium]|nr:DUF2085 domain-containing protein [Vicinamibacterales bacterium]